MKDGPFVVELTKRTGFTTCACRAGFGFEFVVPLGGPARKIQMSSFGFGFDAWLGIKQNPDPTSKSKMKTEIDPRSRTSANRAYNAIAVPEEVEVRGTKRMLKEKSKKAKWI